MKIVIWSLILGHRFLPAQSAQLDAVERQRVVEAAIANLKAHYVYPDVAKKMADALLAHAKSGDYDLLTDGAVFADLLTAQLRDLSNDMHLVIVYRRTPTPERPPGPTPEGIARYRKAMEEKNCTFKKVEILPHNIGYLRLDSFPDPAVCQQAATAAMASLNRADAVIFDLRENGGGYPAMVMLIAAYLFDHPEYMYNPRENTTERCWTQSPVPGSRLADKPVFVLISPKTLSGAEHFSYDLKMLKRATFVGERTGGAAHSGTY
jgi:retinol-binding protein 3